jgi:uncharacterized protein
MELAVVHRWADLAVDALGTAREEIDTLNVYPVPDGDTGTNLYLTASAARDALRESGQVDVVTAYAAYSRGALLGARGNSGVILAQMIGALLRRMSHPRPDEPPAHTWAAAMQEAAEAAYAAVGVPQEGTMLSVLRAAAEAAGKAVTDPQVRTRDAVGAAAEAARQALAETPRQLAALGEAGVVDAGGRGICVLLDALDTALTGRRPATVPGPWHIPIATHVDLSADGPSYEVMYLLDADDTAVPALRERLAALGDSLVVVGGEGLWNVHVHVDDVGAAVEAGIAAGRPHRIRVTHFAEQSARRAEQGRRHRAEQRAPGADQASERPVRVRRTGRAVVAVSAGPGLAALFRQAGAAVVEAAPGRPPSTAEVLAAITGSGAAEVVVLPNDHASLKVAEIAARTAEADLDVDVAVVPTHAQVEGIAALAVHEPGRSFDRDVLEMTATAAAVSQGAVTIATRRAITSAGPCQPGDVLGVVDGDFVVVGEDPAVVAREVLGRLLGAGGELVTLVSGAEDADGVLAAECAAWVEATHPGVGAVVYDGGQERYPLLVAVE